MPWKETNVMSERKDFIKRVRKENANMSQLCKAYQISRKTGYKWLKRYREEGVAGLADRSRRPRHFPNQTPKETERAVIGVREKHPTWGGRKIHARLKRMGHTDVPSPSTITRILARNGYIDPEESKKHKPYQRFEMEQPNQLWQMDFKGYFEIQGQQCHPLTVLDDYSRYLVGLRACRNERRDTVKAHLTDIFREYGMPDAFLVDNGPPWGGIGRQPYYTKLNTWMFRLDIRVIHSSPGHPQTLGKGERLNRTLGADVIMEGDIDGFPGCQFQFNTWRYVYNYERPHEALAMDVPASRYSPSKRKFPEQLPAIDYLSDDVVRKVRGGGLISFQGKVFRVGKAFTGFPVAVRPTLTDCEFEVYFCNQKIKTISFLM